LGEVALEDLEGTDWRLAWVRRNERRRKPGESGYWDGRAEEFRRHSYHSDYAGVFIEWLALEPGESVLDFGCGSGALAVPLARAGHPVVAADFSEGMRQALAGRAAAEGLSGLRIRALSWTDDWPASGLAPKSVDVAVASRSVIVNDLADALAKLDAAARRKAVITMTTEFGPKGYKELGSCAEGQGSYIPDYIYAMNILWQMGAHPELRYLEVKRTAGEDDEPYAEGRRVVWAYIAWEPVCDRRSVQIVDR
jgi:SAM-dependent methyltransferase